jgi:hypothetical protein
MKGLIFYLSILFAGVVATLYSCKDAPIIPITPDDEIITDDESAEVRTDGMTVLGKRLENPYSVENMRKAYSNLKSSDDVPEMEIEPTHLYVRFLPKTGDELDQLKYAGFVLYQYPLDYEILQQGTYYHDPTLPDTVITWQYCKVKVGEPLPDVEYELLTELYIAYDEDELNDADEDMQTKSMDASKSFWERMEDESNVLTGNQSKESQLKGLFDRKWTPSGRIVAWDTSLKKYVPVEGVKVRARYFVFNHESTTDANGYFRASSTTRYDVHYSVIWETHQFSIRDGSGFDFTWWENAVLSMTLPSQAEYVGPVGKMAWYPNITGGRAEYHSVVFRAAHHYYYKDIKGLRRPPENSFWKPQMKIAAIYGINGYNGVYNSAKRFLGIGNQIKIWNYNRPSEEIYGTTIHELAHAAHWNMDASDYRNTDDKVKESWVRGVQWCITQMEYRDYMGGGTILPEYTQVVVDMIDSDVNGVFNYGANYPTDQVTGYTIRELEDALQGQTTWDGWKNNIKNRYTNATKIHLDTLFDHWN